MNITFVVTVTVACLAVTLWNVKLDDVRQSFAEANYVTLPLVFVLLAAYFWLKAVRWAVLLRPLRRLRASDVFGSMMVGFLANNLLPAHLGEFVRVFVLGRRYRLSKMAVLSTVVLERVFDLAAVLAFLGGGLLLAGQALPAKVEIGPVIVPVEAGALAIAGITWAGLLVLSVYVVWPDQFVRAAEALLGRLPGLPARLRRTLVELLRAGAAGLASLRQLSLVLWNLATTLMQWSLMAVMAYVALRSFGVDFDRLPIAAFIVVGLTAVMLLLPAPPGYWGVIQACFTISLGLFDADPSRVFSASVYFHVSQFVPITLVGLWFVNRYGLRLGEISRDARQADADETLTDELSVGGRV